LPAHGAVTNDSTPLISGEYSDELSDIDPRSARLEVDGLDVTDQAMVDSTGILYTPPVPLAEGIHTVELFVADEWGYEAVPVTWSFTIDSTAPTAALTYSVSTTEPTNQDVVATLLPSEWVRVTNNGELTTYTFTENGSFTFEFVDSAGNTGSATATVDNIDKVSPTGIVTYSTIAPTNRDVVATLVPSETVRVTNNGEQRTYTFTGNGSFTFEFVDPAGNTGSVTATVNNIDKAPPIADVSYSTTAPTVGAVVVNLEPSEPITVKNNGGALSYTFTENGTFTFEFVDQVGNPGFATATVQWIVRPPRGLRIDGR
jgi:predicted transcriptional regulator